MTPKGKGAFKLAVPLWREVQSSLAKKIGPAQRAQFKQTLQILTSSATTA
jgi:DNA-binding MarR family transcriptional regulator